MLDARATHNDEDLEETLLKDIAHETFTNEQALAHKEPLLARAVALLVLAVILELAGVR